MRCLPSFTLALAPVYSLLLFKVVWHLSCYSWNRCGSACFWLCRCACAGTRCGWPWQEVTIARYQSRLHCRYNQIEAEERRALRIARAEDER